MIPHSHATRACSGGPGGGGGFLERSYARNGIDRGPARAPTRLPSRCSPSLRRSSRRARLRAPYSSSWIARRPRSGCNWHLLAPVSRGCLSRRSALATTCSVWWPCCSATPSLVCWRSSRSHRSPTLLDGVSRSLLPARSAGPPPCPSWARVAVAGEQSLQPRQETAAPHRPPSPTAALHASPQSRSCHGLAPQAWASGCARRCGRPSTTRRCGNCSGARRCYSRALSRAARFRVHELLTGAMAMLRRACASFSPSASRRTPVAPQPPPSPPRPAAPPPPSPPPPFERHKPLQRTARRR